MRNLICSYTVHIYIAFNLAEKWLIEYVSGYVTKSLGLELIGILHYVVTRSIIGYHKILKIILTGLSFKLIQHYSILLIPHKKTFHINIHSVIALIRTFALIYFSGSEIRIQMSNLIASSDLKCNCLVLVN